MSKHRYYNSWDDPNNLHDEAWEVIRDSLRELAEHRPSGDDSTFDYWPNALIAVQELYGMFVEQESPLEIRDYLIHHLNESCGDEIAQRAIRVLRKAKAVVLINDEVMREFVSDYGLEIQLREE